MTTHSPLAPCRAARLPGEGLAALAGLRAQAGVRVTAGEPAWVEWDGDRPDVIAALLTVAGTELFEPRLGKWFATGSHLPAFGLPPAGQALPLDRAVVPASFVPVEPQTGETRRLPLRLVRSERPRPASALRCPIAALAPWADAAPTAEIAAIRAARYGTMAWLLGERLPAIDGSERFWGERVLTPLGWRAEPDWPESALREAAGVIPDEILVLTAAATEAIPGDAFRALTRSGIRRAIAACPPHPDLQC